MPRPRVLALMLLLPWLAACAPMLAPPGPGATQPAIVERPLGPWRYVTSDGYELVLRRWVPAGKPTAVILALHGFNDHSTFIEGAAQSWAEAGIATYAFDQRGFGYSPHNGMWAGTAAYSGDAATLAGLLQRRYPGLPVFLLGESMGGAVALVAATQHPEAPLAGVILSAPAVWSRDTMPYYQRWALLLASYSIPWFPLTGEGLDIQASDNIEALRALGADPLVIKRTRIDAIHGLVDLMDAALAAAPGLRQRALLLYGAKDELVPVEPMLKLWDSLPAETKALQREALYKNGWHLLFKDLEAKLVIDDVAAWIEEPQSPLPSGADQHAVEALAGLRE